MPAKIVLGAQWGDEGKAKVVDYLTSAADVVVRYQGGANAGHTVVTGDTKFVFHTIPRASCTRVKSAWWATGWSSIQPSCSTRSPS